jgi:hypothetical protein
MKLMSARYQNGSISEIPRTHGFAWHVRFTAREGGKRKQKSLTFSRHYLSGLPPAFAIRLRVRFDVRTRRMKLLLSCQ